MNALIHVQDLSKTFDASPPFLDRVLRGQDKRMVRAVNDVSFTVERGTTLAIVGESGCGKSTLARCVAGLSQPNAGIVRFEGKVISGLTNRHDRRRLARGIQMIFQDPFGSMNPRWRVDRIIGEPLRTLDMVADRTSLRFRVDELLRMVGLSPADGRRYPHEFSGGQRQRIAIARALAAEPAFLICDEPTSALDVSVQAQILNLMRELQDRLGLAYLLITHDLAVVHQMAHWIGVMYLGRMVEMREAASLFEQPAHPYTRALLASAPDPDVIGKSSSPAPGDVPDPAQPPPGCAFHPRCPIAFDACPTAIPAQHTVRQGFAACHGVVRGV